MGETDYVYLWNLILLKLRVTARLKELGKKCWTPGFLIIVKFLADQQVLPFQKNTRQVNVTLKSQGKLHASGRDKIQRSSLVSYYHYLIIKFYSIPNMNNSSNS